MRRRALLALLLIALPASAALEAASRKKAPDPKRPALRLSATTRPGYSPLRVTLSAHLTGVEPTDAAFCHAGIEWESRSPGGVISTSREEPRCLHPADQIEIPAAFSRVVTLSTGTYA